MDSRIRFHFLILVHPFGACYRHGHTGWSECVDRIANFRFRTGHAYSPAEEVLPLYMGWVLDTSGIRHPFVDWLSHEISNESGFLRQADINRIRHCVNANAEESCLRRLQLE